MRSRPADTCPTTSQLCGGLVRPDEEAARRGRAPQDATERRVAADWHALHLSLVCSLALAHQRSKARQQLNATFGGEQQPDIQCFRYFRTSCPSSMVRSTIGADLLQARSWSSTPSLRAARTARLTLTVKSLVAVLRVALAARPAGTLPGEDTQGLQQACRHRSAEPDETTEPNHTIAEQVQRLTSRRARSVVFVLDELSHWLTMSRVDITWDEAKNTANRKKHGVSFEEALELLLSRDDHLVIFDEEHSIDEDRFISIGPIRRGLVLVVWTERDLDVLRVISARWATTNERRLFYSYIGRPQ